MMTTPTIPSARRTELLEAAYGYALEHGIADLSLRPLATSIGSSTGVLRFLFGNKERLLQTLLTRTRAEGRAARARAVHGNRRETIGLASAVEQIWGQLLTEENRPWLRLSNQAYAHAIMEPDGPCAGFAAASVDDWLASLAACQPLHERNSDEGASRRTLALAVLQGALLDLLATGDRSRISDSIHNFLPLLLPSPPAKPC